MDHIKDLLAEVNDQYMVLGEIADHLEKLMREHMEPVPVSGLGRPYPGTHVSDEDTNRAQRLRSPREVFTR